MQRGHVYSFKELSGVYRLKWYYMYVDEGWLEENGSSAYATIGPFHHASERYNIDLFKRPIYCKCLHEWYPSSPVPSDLSCLGQCRCPRAPMRVSCTYKACPGAESLMCGVHLFKTTTFLLISADEISIRVAHCWYFKINHVRTDWWENKAS